MLSNAIDFRGRKRNQRPKSVEYGRVSNDPTGEQRYNGHTLTSLAHFCICLLLGSMNALSHAPDPTLSESDLSAASYLSSSTSASASRERELRLSGGPHGQQKLLIPVSDYDLSVSRHSLPNLDPLDIEVITMSLRPSQSLILVSEKVTNGMGHVVTETENCIK